MIIDPGVVLSYLDKNKKDSSSNSRIITVKTLTESWPQIRCLLEQGITIAVEKTDESVTTLWHLTKNKDYYPWFENKSLKLITSSDSGPEISNLNAEHFLSATIGSQDINLPITYSELDRPYTFLFTNRKIRPHRRYLILELQKQGMLDHALWSCLEGHNTHGHPEHNRIYADDISMPVKKLEPGYDPVPMPDWIDGVIYAAQYQHTWFTLVSETGFEYPYSFRTEKTWKPILAGHPFVICANAGFYRDLKNLGFRTFDRLIDESFDSIIDGKDRLDRLIATVQWLCDQDLAQFWQETRDICLYNHARVLELHNSLKKDFTQRFLDFMNA